MPLIDYHALRSQIDIQDVLDLYDWRPTGRDSNGLRGPCLLKEHSRKGANRLMSVNLERNIWRCFGGDGQGNALDLVAAIERITVYQAALRIADEFGIELPTMPWRKL